MSYLFSFKDAQVFENLLNDPVYRRVLDMEHGLLMDMLKPIRGSRVLVIGCGVGQSLVPLRDAGVLTTGVDSSRHMLDFAKTRLGNTVDLHKSESEELPFEDNSFNYAVMMVSLEFTKYPMKALREACRIAKDKLFIGIINKGLFVKKSMRIKFCQEQYDNAHFYKVAAVRQMAREIMGNVPIETRTACLFPVSDGKIAMSLENSAMMQKFPFGTFGGTLVTLNPTYRTRPLTLKSATGKSSAAPVAGLTSDVLKE